MNINDLEYWKNRVTNIRNHYVSEHSQLLRTKEKYVTVAEIKHMEEKLREFSKKMKRMELFYKRLVK